MSDRVHTVTFNSSSGSASFAIQRKQQASLMPSAALCTPLPSNGASIPVVGSAKVGCPVDARSVEARRLAQFSFSACALSHVSAWSEFVHDSSASLGWLSRPEWNLVHSIAQRRRWNSMAQVRLRREECRGLFRATQAAGRVLFAYCTRPCRALPTVHTT
jgi:hypothetical protein